MGGLMKSQLTRNFLEGSHRFAKTSLGYEASEPPRGVAWIALIRTQQKGTYNDYLAETNFLFFLDGNAARGAWETKKREETEHRTRSLHVFERMHATFSLYKINLGKTHYE